MQALTVDAAVRLGILQDLAEVATSRAGPGRRPQQVGPKGASWPIIPVGILLEKAKVGVTSGPAWHLSHLSADRGGGLVRHLRRALGDVRLERERR
jgi:hypothetical protein